jgi:two-component system chemotaxis response regulator CheB
LWELEEDELVRFRCRVGHAYAPETLLAEQSDALEDALWIALRALEESAALAERMSDRAKERGNTLAAERFAEQGHGTKQRAAVVRAVLLRGRMAAPTSHEAALEQETGLNANPLGELPSS